MIEYGRAGDGDAISELFERHRRSLLMVARKVARNATEADDAVSEAFAGLLSALRAGKGPTDYVIGYLARSVRHAAIRLASANRPTAELDHDPVEPRDAIGHVAESDAVRRAFDALPPRWRELLWLTEVEGLTRHEIAERLGGSPTAIAMAASRAREGLRLAYLAVHLPPTASDECRAVLDDLPALVRGKPRQRRALDDHLASCPDCERAAATLQAMNRHLAEILLVALTGEALVHRLAGRPGRVAEEPPLRRGLRRIAVLASIALLTVGIDDGRGGVPASRAGVEPPACSPSIARQIDRPTRVTSGPAPSLEGMQGPLRSPQERRQKGLGTSTWRQHGVVRCPPTASGHPPPDAPSARRSPGCSSAPVWQPVPRPGRRTP